MRRESGARRKRGMCRRARTGCGGTGNAGNVGNGGGRRRRAHEGHARPPGASAPDQSPEVSYSPVAFCHGGPRGINGCIHPISGGCPKTLSARALPPIRTLTVGPGVSPGQPVDGFDRVADCNRRLGISPTPEHAALSCSFSRRAHRGRFTLHYHYQCAMSGKPDDTPSMMWNKRALAVITPRAPRPPSAPFARPGSSAPARAPGRSRSAGPAGRPSPTDRPAGSRAGRTACGPSAAGSRRRAR